MPTSSHDALPRGARARSKNALPPRRAGPGVEITFLGVLLAVLAPLGAHGTGPSVPPKVEWEPVEGGRRTLLRAPSAAGKPGPRFTEVDARSAGMLWTNRLSTARYTTRQNLMNGAGVALADVDGDGWCDVFLCNKDAPSVLYRNLGDWRFEDITAQASVGSAHLIATGAVFGDVNGDGRPDLFVTSFLGPDALYLNQGGGRFTDATTASGVASKGGTTSAALGDIDGDGDLDLYVCHFGIEAILRDGAVISTRNVGGQPVVMGRFARRLKITGDKMVEFGDPDVLYLNDGNGLFTPCPWTRFLDEEGNPLREPPNDFGLSVTIRDLNGDGSPDIYVCSDFQTPDRIWFGDGKGGFRAAPRLAFRNMSYASMGVDMADLARAGRLDILAVEMLSRDYRRHLAQRSPMDPEPRMPGDVQTREMVARNTLQHDRGDGSYAEIGWSAGLAMSDWSWTPVFLDVDLDGFEDLIVSNGHMHDVNDLDVNASRSSDPAKRAQETAQQILLSYPALNPPKAAWRNRGDLTFEDRSAEWQFNNTHILHGMALADLDHDGDPDVVGNAWNQPPFLARLDTPGPRVAIRLRGPTGNPTGTGARIRVLGGAVPVQEQEIRAGGRYLSADDPQLMFATGTATSLVAEVRWRSGRQSLCRDLRPGYLYELEEPSAAAPPRPHTPTPAGPPVWFSPVPTPADFSHQESPFDDFARQRLLPWRLSRLGPGLAMVREGDRRLLVLGGARGGSLQVLEFNGRGVTPALAPPPGNSPLPDDTTALLAVELVPGQPSLLVGLSHFESGNPAQPAVLRFDRVAGAWTPGESLPPNPAVTGALAAGDFDGDGDPDLVVAGRFQPGRYPEPCDIRVFRNDQGRLVPDSGRSDPLRRLGIVTGVVTADFDQDGTTDLAVACEWGPLRLFLNRGGTFVAAPATRSLQARTGLWQCLLAADFDGDGRMDLAAGNWGWNDYRQRAPGGPWNLWFGPVDETGHVGILEAYTPAGEPPGFQVPFRLRDALATEFPWLKARFPKHHAFATAGIAAILGDKLRDFQSLQVTTLASMVFLNRGDSFEAIELPREAQWTPILGMAAADLDGDGKPDLVCAQNLFAVRDEDDRQDAGRGLVLRNLGEGRWTPLATRQSGLELYGDQRAVLAEDLDGDGRRDLAIGMNAGPAVILQRSPIQR